MNINGYTLACPIEILPPRGKKTISLDGHIILVIVCDSEIYAVLENHPENAHSLAHGTVLNGVLILANGAHYDLKTGKYLGGCPWTSAHDSLHMLNTKVIDGGLYIRV